MNTTQKGNEFENIVFSILKKTHPKHIEFYRGGSDRGKDIVAMYEYNGITKTVIVECKNHNSSIKQKDICESLNWAVSAKPDLFYIWTSTYLTPTTKDYILSISKQYKLNVAWEEKISLEKYTDVFNHKDDDQLFLELKKRIYNLLNIAECSYELEYTSRILPSNHALINRKQEKAFLLDDYKHIYYLMGPSCVGKTQLAKCIAKDYFENGRFVFWHRVFMQDNECQIKSLLEALGTFFACVLKRNELNEYLNSHGNYLTSSLINIVKTMLSNYDCVLFIDDIHKCNSNQYIELLIQLLDVANSKIYLLGWFNIFDIHDLRLNNKIVFMDVKPLSAQHIREIALSINGTLNDEELGEIVDRSAGLPGLAEILPTNKNYINCDGLLSYFGTLISLMEIKEKSLLFSLALSRAPLPIKLLERYNYRSTFEKLTQKRLAKLEGDVIVLHDMYKKYVKDLSYLIPEETFHIIEMCAEDNPLLYIDLMTLYCETEKSDKYDKILKEKFDFLLSMGYDVMLLYTLQEREKLNKKNALFILIKKMILLERKAEYDLLGNYISITKDIIDRTNEDYYMWNYLNLRLNYFQCNFEKLLKFFYDNIAVYQNYPIELYLQILFIIGRTYYVIGEMRIAVGIYYYIFNLAIRNNLSSLSTKAIHRICIIEEKIGLFRVASQTLELLMDTRYFVSIKRQAFAYYRLSKCALGNGNYEEAIKYNNKSIEIKKSLNAQRGLAFSMKLHSQIYYKMRDIPKAIYWGEEAYKKAQQLNLKKEEVATGITYAYALLAADQAKHAQCILNTCIKHASKMNLEHRLKAIISLCDNYNLFELKKIAIDALLSAEKYMAEIMQLYKRHLHETIANNTNLGKIDDLIDHQRALSPSLMIL